MSFIDEIKNISIVDYAKTYGECDEIKIGLPFSVPHCEGDDESTADGEA